MMVFSSLDSAQEHGFHWVDFRPDLGVHVVEKVLTRNDGQKVKALAFARPESQ
jgi:hypothetical protein